MHAVFAGAQQNPAGIPDEQQPEGSLGQGETVHMATFSLI